MTVHERERLSVVEQKVDDVKEDVAEIKSDMKDLSEKLDLFIKSADDKFLTVAQAKLIGWIVGFLLTVTTIAIAVLNYLKH